jgi:hypothetical protein
LMDDALHQKDTRCASYIQSSVLSLTASQSQTQNPQATQDHKPV